MRRAKMYSEMWRNFVILVIMLINTAYAVQQQWDYQYYPSTDVIEQLGLDVTDRTEFDTTALAAEEERTQSLFNRSEETKDEESNATIALFDEFADQENSESESLTPAVYAPQAKMYIKEDSLLLHKANGDKQTEQEEEPRILNRFSLKRLTSIPSLLGFDREDHNSVYHNNDQQISPGSSIKPVLEDEQVTEIVEEVTTVVTTTTTMKLEKRIGADAKSLGYLIKDLYLRTPLAALVDTHAASLKQSRALWESAVSANSTLSIVLVPFNSSGVGEIAYARGGRGFRAALRSLKPSVTGHSFGSNFDESIGGAAFFGILRAAQLVPYDSAIFLCTDRSPGDPELAQLAATTLIRKRIRLYTLWFGSTIETSNDDEQLYETDGQGGSESLLSEAALRSGGEWINILGEPAVSAQISSEEFLPSGQLDEHIATLAARKHLHGQQAISLIVDNSITSLHFEIKGTVSEARLRVPNGQTIDLLNATSVSMFSDNSRSLQSTRDEVKALISLPDNRERKGEWALLTNQRENSGEYNLTVRANSAIGFEAMVRRDDKENGSPILRLKIRGPLESIGGVSIVDSTGREITNLPYTTSSNTSGIKGKLREDDEVVVAAEKLPDSDFYVRLLGKDDYGADISRLSYVTKTQIQLANPTMIEVGQNSKLILTPGSRGQVEFEVTNQRNVPVLYFFSCSDTERFLHGITPDRMFVQPGQTINVIVYLLINANAQDGTTDQLTFRASDRQSQEITTKSALLQVSTLTASQDTARPDLYYNYGSRCEGKLDYHHCTGTIWTLQITARDYETGLLSLKSVPKGLVTKPYSAGTKEEVTAFYSASCCTPRVVITATDLAGNQRSYTIDVSDIYLDAASIGLIVLGVLLLIALIVILVFAIRACLKRKRDSRNLPVYRGART